MKVAIIGSESILHHEQAARVGFLQADNEVKICIPSLVNQTFLNACTQAMGEANTADVSFRCTLGGSLEACTALINAGAADLVLMGGMFGTPLTEGACLAQCALLSGR